MIYVNSRCKGNQHLRLIFHFKSEILGWSNIKAVLDSSRFGVNLCFLSVYSLVDSSVGDHQQQGPGDH